MKKFLLTLALAALAGCASSGQESGQGSVTQNVRGGIFASYTGAQARTTTPSETKIEGTVDDRVINLTVTAGAPFVLTFGDIQADTDAGTTGQTQDAISSANSTETKPTTDLNLTGK